MQDLHLKVNFKKVHRENTRGLLQTPAEDTIRGTDSLSPGWRGPFYFSLISRSSDDWLQLLAELSVLPMVERFALDTVTVIL